MTHFPNIEPAVRARLAARGIDPELSCDHFLDAIRDGNARMDSRRAGYVLTPRHRGLRVPIVIPMAVVIP